MESSSLRRGATVAVLGTPQPFASKLLAAGFLTTSETARPAPAIVIALGADSDMRGPCKRARSALGPRGRVYLLAPAPRILSLWRTLRTLGLEPKRTLFVHPDPHGDATDAVVVARAAKRGGLSVELAPRS